MPGHAVSVGGSAAQAADQWGMNTQLRGIVVGLVVVMSVGTLGVASSSAATLKPRTVMLEKLNAVRAQHGLAAVRPSLLLRLAAKRHSDDMVVRDYFAHTSPGGATLYDRITKSGFVAGYSWEGGETLAWGTGVLAKPGYTVKAWLASPEHRAILLSSTWTRIGISRACGSFLGHTGACVWTADWVKRW
jgi:uncharacterized protein YkwD